MSGLFIFGSIIGSISIIGLGILHWNDWKPLYAEHDGVFWICFGLFTGAIINLLRLVLYPDYYMGVISTFTIPANTPTDPIAIALALGSVISGIMFTVPLVLWLFGYYDKNKVKKITTTDNTDNIPYFTVSEKNNHHVLKDGFLFAMTNHHRDSIAIVMAMTDIYKKQREIDRLEDIQMERLEEEERREYNDDK